MSEVTVKDRKPVDASNKGVAPGDKQPWDAVVDVFLHSETPGDFTVRSNLQAPGSDELVFRNDGHPGFNVIFNLHDETQLGYRFPAPPKDFDSIWSQVGASGCPGSPGAWEVFDKASIVVTNGGDVMKAKNRNPSPAQGQFRYTLNVTKDGGATYLPLDPGGNNQNGASLT